MSQGTMTLLEKAKKPRAIFRECVAVHPPGECPKVEHQDDVRITTFEEFTALIRAATRAVSHLSREKQDSRRMDLAAAG